MFRVHTPIIRSIRWYLRCLRCRWCRAARHHPHRKHDLRSGSQDHHPSKNSVQKTICCNSTSNAPDDGRMYPKSKNTSVKLPSCIKLAFHFISCERCTVQQPSRHNMLFGSVTGLKPFATQCWQTIPNRRSRLVDNIF